MAVACRKPRGAADLLIGAVVLFSISSLAVWLWHVPQPDGARERHALAGLNLAFGSVWEQQGFEWEFPIVNRAPHPIEIFHVDGDCSCTVVDPQKLTLAAGETAHLKATIDLRQSDWGDGETSRRVQIRIFPRLASDLNQTAECLLQGTVRKNPIRVAGDVLEYGDELLEGGPFEERSVTFELSGDHDWGPPEATCEPQGAGTARIERLDDGPGRFRLVVRPAGDAPAGELEFTVDVAASCDGFSEPATRRVRVRGRVQKDVEARPSSVHFGLRAIGTADTEFLVISSRRLAPILVDAFETSDPDLSLRAVSDAESIGTCVFEVTQEFTRAARQSATMTLHVRYADAAPGDTHDLVIPVYYMGESRLEVDGTNSREEEA